MKRKSTAFVLACAGICPPAGADLAVDFSRNQLRGDRRGATLEDFRAQDPILADNTVLHRAVGIPEFKDLNVTDGVLTSSHGDTFKGTGSVQNQQWNQGLAIVGESLYCREGSNGFPDRAPTVQIAGMSRFEDETVVTVTVWGVGDVPGQETRFTAAFGDEAQILSLIHI